MELQSVWGWQPALYLFLGGMGAGAFIMAAILYLKDKEHHGKIVCVSMWAAAISLVVGLLLLLMELVTPIRGLLMWQSFSHFTSWMTYGAWGAFGAIVAFGLSALLATPQVNAWLAEKLSWFGPRERSIRTVLAVIGMVLGAFVAFYTGMLLMASGSVPFWDTLLLPALFTVSAFDTGVASWFSFWSRRSCLRFSWAPPFPPTPRARQALRPLHRRPCSSRGSWRDGSGVSWRLW